MAVIVSLYDHTRSRFLSGLNQPGTDWLINLYTVLPFNQNAVTKAAAETGATQVATANGYTQNGKALTGVAVTIQNESEGKFDANDVTWTATGGSIVADFAMIYDNTGAGKEPLLHIDFGGTITASNTINFVIQWNSAGILVLA